MIILTYDIRDDKLRTRFSKFLLAYGRRLQYSVYEINNSERILEMVKVEIKKKFEKKFEQSDSVLIFHLSKTCDIIRFGYAKNEETDLVIC
ncbi:CRISPR-associated endonuclease Cas2 [Candidatus Woesearchaeota archaeon]|nr:CRISPR-associated endonuclease Cas2 [Nanoarchaeota archaeon]MCB9370307.1 CRISPR-associated endonuclease Cas2 [Candidatus Woesearchaeota archaeon]USN44831.1 MAG: CRISPR-associated endonuclease Cas2 [Candidatus Woesearchaeota archaeon]